MLQRLLLLALILPGLLLAAEPTRVVFHLNEAEKLPLLVNNTTNLKKDLGNGVLIEVVVNGPAITRLASSSNTGEQLQKMLDAGIEIGGCSNAIRASQIDPSKLYPGIRIVEEGGVTRLLRRQQQGYFYIKI
jgi:intracellular sulfur oxidation DsrE/DsrF family protein